MAGGAHRPETVAARSSARARARQERAQHRVPQPDPRPRPPVLVSTEPDCQHGTEGGYVEYGCRCIQINPDGTYWGCGIAGPEARRLRRSPT